MKLETIKIQGIEYVGCYIICGHTHEHTKFEGGEIPQLLVKCRKKCLRV